MPKFAVAWEPHAGFRVNSPETVIIHLMEGYRRKGLPRRYFPQRELPWQA